MKSVLLTFVFMLFFGLTGRMQTNVDLFASMAGFHIMENNDVIPIWGYGYEGDQYISLPSPLLTFGQGENVVINMYNDSPEAHTIHLHGLDVDQVNDGVPNTSFFVFPDQSASYSFSATYPGNYLYHCHVTTTLHLTMGMYGMIVVNYSDDQLYENGPYFDRAYPLLMSDLEVEVNSSILNAAPFHEIRPDYFMVNGKAGTMLTENTEEHLHYQNGENVVLRLGSVAYSKVLVAFPDELNAQVFTSDGRPLPEPFSADTLEIFPGERFSVICSPEEDFNGSMTVLYESMINKEIIGENTVLWSQGIPDDVSETHVAEWNIYPNPSSGRLGIDGLDRTGETFTIYDLSGRVHKTIKTTAGMTQIAVDLSFLKSGVYIITDDQGKSRRLLIGDF